MLPISLADEMMARRILRSVIQHLFAGSALLLSFYVHSQPTHNTFRHITRNHGLSQSNVTSIIQDHDGFMWFGTRDGLNKYDGYKITIYRNDPANHQSISHNYIRTIYEDKKHRLWIGTEDGGLNLYNPASDNFSRYVHQADNPRSLSANKVKALFEDSQGRLWVGTGGGGLNLFLPEQNVFSCYRHSTTNLNSISSDHIEDITEDSDGNLWIATWNAGLNALHMKSGKFTRFRAHAGNASALSSDYLKKLFVDTDNNLWIGTTEGGLNRYDKDAHRFIHYTYSPDHHNGISNNDVLSIAEDKERNLWIGTQNGGINILDKGRKKFFHIHYDEHLHDGLNNGSIYSLYNDRQGNMWVGTFSGGVNFWNNTPPKFKNFVKNNDPTQGLNNANVLSVYEDSIGNLYIGTDGGGLSIYRQRKFTHLLHDAMDKNSIRSNYPLCIYEDTKGDVWVGCFYGKASMFNKRKNNFNNSVITPDLNHVSTICEDTITGKIWMGTWGDGIIVYDKFTGASKQYLPHQHNRGSLSHNIIFAIYQDRQGDIWVGTEGGGLNQYNRTHDNFIHFEYDPASVSCISNNIINSIYEDKRGNLWIGTHGGLSVLNRSKRTFLNYTTRDGLPNNVIQAIEEDDTGHLWLSTNKGISRFDFTKKTFRNYDISDGLASESFNRMSSFKNRRGEIYFGGIHGLSFFHPDSIADNDYAPPIYFTELQIFNKPINFRDKDSPLRQPIAQADTLVLSYKHAVFSLEFVALNYAYSEKIQYAYKLEGFDDEWNFVGTQRKATYTNLDPGEYVLRVKASNNDGVWHEGGNAIRIIITPPFWKTWWAKGLYLLILFGLLFVLRIIMIQRMKVRNRLEMDDIKLRFYANISHEFRTPLTLILGPLNQLTASSHALSPEDRPLLQLMQRNGQNLLKLINQLMHIYELDAGFMKLKVMKVDMVAFVKGLKEAFKFTADQRNIRYEFSSSIPQAETYFDPDKLEKILLNLISNAFKHTSDHGQISVDLRFFASDFALVPAHILKHKRVARTFVSISIKDNGAGINKANHQRVFDPFFRVEDELHAKEGNGIGLSLARQLAVLHHGDIILESEEGSGSTFTLWLPVDDEVFHAEQITSTHYDFANRHYDFRTTHGLVTNADDYVGAMELQKKLPVLLVVEDNCDIRMFLKLNFGTTFQIEEAEHGAVGLEKAYTLLPDIILSDVMMPEMDGVSMCLKIKQDIRTSHIPIILLTARADEDFQLHVFKTALADDYITKPFSAPILLAKLCNIIEFRERLKKKHYRDMMANPTSPTVPSFDQIFIKKAVAIVESNLDDLDFNVEKFCRELGMSQTNLYRKLQALLGVSANQFIKDIRMKRAVQLLSSGQYPVQEIACLVGFADAKYFSKSFKKQFGVLPSAYLASEKNVLH